MPRLAAVFIVLSMVFGFVSPAGAAPAQAADRSVFLQSVRGVWNGKGQVVAGRYKGVKFSCSFTAPASDSLAAMQFNGICRSGIFSQPIKASISRKGNGFQGSFNEGAKGNGLDITAATLEKNRITLELNREKLRGNMTARLIGGNRLSVTLAVRIDDEIIPVIGIDLTRAEPAAVAAAKSGNLFAWLSN